ncbi:hypothetical protein [Micromonospora sp. CPCC 206061]|uniref:hypothetical protein n=1 Tax=Micromonospora sp. CPCC 206061 TaxID=3122410 RepID=UPI002FF323C7
MTEPVAGAGTMRVTASNGVTWTRRPGMTSTAEQLLQALSDLTGIYSDPARQWNWWQEGRRDQEYDLVLQVVSEWDKYGPRRGSADEKTAPRHAEPDTFGKDLDEDTRRGPDLVVEGYDENRERLRLRLLRTQSDVAFFGHVLQTPASSAQRDDAEHRLNASRAAAAGLLDQLGDPEQVIDRHGRLPAERREMNLQSHMQYWRHPTLRSWTTTQRRRFNALLAMPLPDPAAMCSECQAPSAWHDYDISLRLFQPPPAPGTQAGQLAQLIPGWWQRCPACTTYRVGHQWGGQYALPDFSYDQWRAMLPPLLRTIFTPSPPRPRPAPRPQPKPLAVIPSGPITEVRKRLEQAETRYPTAHVRPGSTDGWEVWPAPQ